jgi:hypothetical protein
MRRKLGGRMCRYDLAFSMAKQFPANVWPKFFHDVESRIKTNLLAPLVHRISKAPVCRRIVHIGNPGRDRIPKHLRSTK